jgi:hypothetical protein
MNTFGRGWVNVTPDPQGTAMTLAVGTRSGATHLHLLDRTGVKLLLLVATTILGMTIPVYPAACLAIVALTFVCLLFDRLDVALLFVAGSVGLFTDGWNPNRSVDDVVFRINVAHIYVSEIVIYTLTIIYFFQQLLRRDRRMERMRGALDRVLPIFAVSMLGFMFYGYMRTHDAAGAFGYHGGRVFLVSVAFYFLLMNTLTGTNAAIRLFKWFFVAVTVKAAYALIGYLGGFGSAHDVYSGIRVPLYEIEDSFALAVCVAGAVSGIVFGVLKRFEGVFALIASSIMLIDIVLSLRRSVWICLAVACIFLTCPAAQRMRIAICGFVFALALVILAPDVSQRVEERIGFLSDLTHRPELSWRQAGDVEFHYNDIRDSWSAFKGAPFGKGFPGGYRRVFTANSKNEYERYLGTGVTHNEVLNFGIKMGIIGIALYFLLLAGFSRDVYKSLRLADPRSKALLVTCLGTVLGGAAFGLTSAHLIGNTKYPMMYFMLLALAMVVRSQLLSRRQAAAHGNQSTS